MNILNSIITNDYLGCYFGGYFLVAYLIFLNGPPISLKGRKTLSVILSFVAWPILLPFSFLCLWFTLSYVNNKVCSWLIKKMGMEFTINGEEVLK